MNLFNLKVPYEQTHPHLKKILETKDIFKMDVLQDWSKGFIDRDGKNKFIKEFQTTFNSSFWELYIFAVLRELRRIKGNNFNINLDNHAPDFHLPNLNLAIEATVALNAENDISEDCWLEPNELDSITECNIKSIIRLSNSILSKSKKYLNSYEKLPHIKNCAYIIAIQDFSQPHSYLGANRNIEAILYDYYVDEDKDRNGTSLYGESIQQVTKNNGSPIKLGLFNNEEYSHISAIIFNPMATMGKVTALSNDPRNNCIFRHLRYNHNSPTPYIEIDKKSTYLEHLFDGMTIYHNPFAKKPLQPTIFEHKKISQIQIVNGEKFGFIPYKHLLFRSVFSA
ncbi:hypothetical protein [Rodentibacter trehalosifermentans]|uniref:Glycosaminoglycan attachment site n=1 Tax=Rodentibacter trehalosifermentans TaxID=1908263 RepID=A0A1V3IVV6_9PAST|nr:hypothetical protein [Rodentibacter trehalosifermentans]OOF46405.1 hypothetical protein BKK51_02665 [Rodentibacter trehalosifermentans]OOF53654.1 hypothetical protein BKK53_00620 [Rodentibacter trehalosifermentans]